MEMNPESRTQKLSRVQKSQLDPENRTDADLVKVQMTVPEFMRVSTGLLSAYELLDQLDKKINSGMTRAKLANFLALESPEVMATMFQDIRRAYIFMARGIGELEKQIK